jgi:hypothetical protein
MVKMPSRSLVAQWDCPYHVTGKAIGKEKFLDNMPKMAYLYPIFGNE